MARPLISANNPPPVEYAISPSGHIKPVPIVSNKSGALIYKWANRDKGEPARDKNGHPIVLCKEEAQAQGWASVQANLSEDLYDEFMRFQADCIKYRKQQKPADWPKIEPTTGLPPHLIPDLVKERRGIVDTTPVEKSLSGSARVVDAAGSITAEKPKRKKVGGKKAD